MPRRSREDMFEWRDDNTEEVWRCPRIFMKVKELLRPGAKNTRYAGNLLRMLGVVSLDARDRARNERHLRKAIQILRLQGMIIADVRSGKGGGYFIATPEDRKEVERWLGLDEKLARSMLRKVEEQRERFEELCRRPPDGDPPGDEPQEGMLF